MKAYERIRDFMVLEELGHGGMGGVYLGYDYKSRQLVAIKTLFPEFARDEAYILRFKREASVYQKLDHPNIVHYVDAGIEDITYFIALEFIRGKALDDVLKDRVAIPPAEALAIFQPLAEAVTHAHERSIVHRDLKPQNVIISDDGVVKLLDFGIAQADDDIVKTVTGSVLGTFFYSSPEQNQGKKTDQRSDIYSLGLILFELVTGKRALSGNDPMQIALIQMKGAVPRPTDLRPDVPPALEEIILRCLKKDPNDRYHNCADLVRDVGMLRANTRALGAAGPLAAPEIAEKWVKAKEAYGKKDIDAALRFALEVQEKAKDIAEVHHLLAQVYTERNVPFQAIEEFKRAIQLAPTDSQYVLDYGLALLKMKMVPNAKEVFKGVLAKDPMNVYAKAYLNKIKQAEQEALRRREEALRKKPEEDPPTKKG